MVVKAKTQPEVASEGNNAIKLVVDWHVDYGQAIAQEKTKCREMAGRRRLTPISFWLSTSEFGLTDQ